MTPPGVEQKSLSHAAPAVRADVIETMTPPGVEQHRRRVSQEAVAAVIETMTPPGVEQVSLRSDAPEVPA